MSAKTCALPGAPGLIALPWEMALTSTSARSPPLVAGSMEIFAVVSAGEELRPFGAPILRLCVSWDTFIDFSPPERQWHPECQLSAISEPGSSCPACERWPAARSEEHTSELQS